MLTDTLPLARLVPATAEQADTLLALASACSALLRGSPAAWAAWAATIEALPDDGPGGKRAFLLDLHATTLAGDAAELADRFDGLAAVVAGVWRPSRN